MSKLRIATWNLQHASTNGPSSTLQIARLRTFNPDIIVLTETDDDVDLSLYGYHSACSEKNDYGKYCSVIWSKYPFTEKYQTYETDTAVCAQVDTQLGPLIVYGTIITY